jgi:hypothetical protein
MQRNRRTTLQTARGWLRRTKWATLGMALIIAAPLAAWGLSGQVDVALVLAALALAVATAALAYVAAQSHKLSALPCLTVSAFDFARDGIQSPRLLLAAFTNVGNSPALECRVARVRLVQADGATKPHALTPDPEFFGTLPPGAPKDIYLLGSALQVLGYQDEHERLTAVELEITYENIFKVAFRTLTRFSRATPAGGPSHWHVATEIAEPA